MFVKSAVNSLSVCICLMFPGRVFYVRASLTLKLSWYITAFANGVQWQHSMKTFIGFNSVCSRSQSSVSS